MWGILLTAAGVLDLYERIFAQKTDIPTWLRISFMGIIVIVAQGFAYKQLSDNKRSAAVFRIPPPPAPILQVQQSEEPKVIYRTIPSDSAALADKEKEDERKKTRNAIAMMLSQGVQIEGACLATQENRELGQKANEWATRTYGFLNAIDTAYGARFLAAGGPSYSHLGVPQNNDNIWNFINLRCQVLSAILAELHD